ncbi:MAG TPA: phosphoribosyltransferase family protein [Candidatus Bathyarchaeia archaeon]|nr:phosphoribosyltransferase family protein [Candidatus Bathyarchaeia archaeon]
MKLEFLYLSWEKLHQLSFDLLKEINKKGIKFDRIVCISRGGLVVSRIFSDFLKLPISNFTIVSYVSVGKTGIPKIVEPLGVKIKNERILLVDEIVDHGTTLEKALSYLKRFRPQKIHSLGLVIKPWTKLKPDFWQLETEKWVIFPYEVRETIDDLRKIWGKENVSKEEISERLGKIGLTKKQVDYFLKIS